MKNEVETSWREINERYNDIEKARKKHPLPLGTRRSGEKIKSKTILQKRDRLSNIDQQFIERLRRVADQYNIKDVNLECIIEKLHCLNGAEKKVSNLLSKWADR
ncbi:hypothetical protein GCM10007416_05300 [Kroppenstedtia guangzhouensis]|uniref:Uncharacterized protein n=1 Tax=Kroppenstedtia guangzhouensis TaxID=1274356 RepID=A0ABQ1G3K5_9BACL|nr:hypothetical protein [Kroppenstedtia guangzhouensis]GGA35416.1 hypothetical protein GCM10007416_05300 [Kroppenstedtia guangzhouensis]